MNILSKVGNKFKQDYELKLWRTPIAVLSGFMQGQKLGLLFDKESMIIVQSHLPFPV